MKVVCPKRKLQIKSVIPSNYRVSANWKTHYKTETLPTILFSTQIRTVINNNWNTLYEIRKQSRFSFYNAAGFNYPRSWRER